MKVQKYKTEKYKNSKNDKNLKSTKSTNKTIRRQLLVQKEKQSKTAKL